MLFHAAMLDSLLEGPSVQRKQGEFKVSEFLCFLFEDAYENVKREQVPQLPFCGIFGRLLTKNVPLEVAFTDTQSAVNLRLLVLLPHMIHTGLKKLTQ